MLSSNCFSVACKSADACKTQPANPSRYNPKISYVREYGSTELIGKVIVILTQTETLKTDRQGFLIQKNSIYSMGVMFTAYQITTQFKQTMRPFKVICKYIPRPNFQLCKDAINVRSRNESAEIFFLLLLFLRLRFWHKRSHCLFKVRMVNMQLNYSQR